MRPENRELWRRYRKEGDVEARSNLLEQHLGLVRSCANRVVRSVQGVVELDDLVSSGTLGLVQALESFDPGRGVAFSTYAMRRIHGAILDELRSRDWMTRATRNRARELAHVVSELENRLGRAPDQGEIAEALGVSMSDYWRFWADVTPPRIVSLSTPSATTHDSPPLEDTIAVCEEDPVKGVIADERRVQLTKALLSLPERDRQVLALSYYEGLNLREIGEVLHVTESRVSQIRTRALRRLRDCAALAEATL